MQRCIFTFWQHPVRLYAARAHLSPWQAHPMIQVVVDLNEYYTKKNLKNAPVCRKLEMLGTTWVVRVKVYTYTLPITVKHLVVSQYAVHCSLLRHGPGSSCQLRCV
jgi:hypothetical protein